MYFDEGVLDKDSVVKFFFTTANVMIYIIGKDLVMRLRTNHGDSPICGEASLFFNPEMIVLPSSQKSTKIQVSDEHRYPIT